MKNSFEQNSTSQSTLRRLGEHDISTTADGVTTEDVAIKKVTTHEGYTTTALQVGVHYFFVKKNF
jgi:hypothetical protein